MSENADLKKKKVLILDDEKMVCDLIRDILDDLELDITDSGSVKESQQLCEDKNFDLIILDYNVKDGVGWPLVEKISSDPEKYGDPVCLFMSGTVDFSLSKNYPSMLTTQFIGKPFEVLEFKETVIKLLN